MSQPTTLYLMRHGETDWNGQRRWQAQLDIPLNDTGRRQAAELADTVATLPLAALYSSDLGRALETAEIIAARHPGGLAVRLEPRFREHDAGVLAGHTLAELETLYPEWWAADRADPLNTRCPGGETFTELQARVREAVAEIAALHPGQAVGIVGHGGSLRAVLFDVLGLAGQHVDSVVLHNCGLTVVEWSERPRLLALNVSGGWLGRPARVRAPGEGRPPGSPAPARS